ncbi:unnamed protein product, partial [Rotaria sordida]
MPQKKQKEPLVKQLNTYVALRDKKTSRCYVVSRDHLSFAKKDNLKVGTSATFNEPNDPSHRFHGIVITCGTKQQCEKSILLIEKSNNNNSKESEDTESVSSNQLIIDEQTENNDDDNDGDEELENENQVLTCVSKSRKVDDVMVTSNNSTMSSKSAPDNNCSSSALQPTTISSNPIVLQNINSNVDVVHKRKEISDESTSVKKKPKHSTTVSHSDYEKLKREKKQLQKQVNIYKNNWMPRPTGPVAAYFIDVGKILSGATIVNDEEGDKGDKLEKICLTLNMSERELQSCEHETDITKTCRQIIKFVYRDPVVRSEMLVSSMTAGKLQAIQVMALTQATNHQEVDTLSPVLSSVTHMNIGYHSDTDISISSDHETQSAVESDSEKNKKNYMDQEISIFESLIINEEQSNETIDSMQIATALIALKSKHHLSNSCIEDILVLLKILGIAVPSSYKSLCTLLRKRSKTHLTPLVHTICPHCQNVSSKEQQCTTCGVKYSPISPMSIPIFYTYNILQQLKAILATSKDLVLHQKSASKKTVMKDITDGNMYNGLIKNESESFITLTMNVDGIQPNKGSDKRRSVPTKNDGSVVSFAIYENDPSACARTNERHDKLLEQLRINQDHLSKLTNKRGRRALMKAHKIAQRGVSSLCSLRTLS